MKPEIRVRGALHTLHRAGKAIWKHGQQRALGGCLPDVKGQCGCHRRAGCRGGVAGNKWAPELSLTAAGTQQTSPDRARPPAAATKPEG